eukprot:CAMPEP_0170371944 /NCGR_PEP_ID=MMETSP0117_2-20130122/9296_1 /TAXON_ID=400756 /ORGANISM="Durinskia baltica, Strain CSIRO CS-38" /LENGTH=144 /DNA_ID=CAMNT_0010626783 /DNA_START=175 /DNA_END=608 /DNA_ORIENTATION=-
MKGAALAWSAQPAMSTGLTYVRQRAQLDNALGTGMKRLWYEWRCEAGQNSTKQAPSSAGAAQRFRRRGSPLGIQIPAGETGELYPVCTVTAELRNKAEGRESPDGHILASASRQAVLGVSPSDNEQGPLDQSEPCHPRGNRQAR